MNIVEPVNCNTIRQKRRQCINQVDDFFKFHNKINLPFYKLHNQ